MSAELIPWILVGVVAGVVAGAAPGLSGAMAMVLALPLSLEMPAESAMVLMVSMYVGSVSGGLIAATLTGVADAETAAAARDARALALKGRPRRALALGIGASLVGGLVSWSVLVAVAKPVAAQALGMSAFDFAALVLLAMVLAVAISPEKLISGLSGAFLGLVCALPGINPATGQARLSFGFAQLEGGFRLLPVLIGLCAVSQVIRLCLPEPEEGVSGSAGNVPSAADWLRQLGNLARSSVVGVVVGVLPGVSTKISSMLAYDAARVFARDREEFGQGADSAVAASESARSAVAGGGLVPLVSLGIPGSVIGAILLGAFVIHGLQPGPMLFEHRIDVVGAISWSYLGANLVVFVLMWYGMGLAKRVTRIPLCYTAAVVLVFSVAGCYAVSNRMFDVWVMLGFGALGLVMDRLRIALAPFILGFVLGPMFEERLVTALAASGGNWAAWFSSPFSVIVLVLSAAVLLVSILGRLTSAPRALSLPK